MFEELKKAMNTDIDTDSDENLAELLREEEELVTELSQKLALCVVKFLLKHKESSLDAETMNRIISKAIAKIHYANLASELSIDNKLVLTKEDYEKFSENIKAYEKMLFDNVIVVD